MFRFIVFVCFMGVVSLSFADDKQDQTALQGKWVVHNGPIKSMVLTFNKDKFSLKAEDREFTGTFTIDSSKSPKTMDLTVTGGEGSEVDRYKEMTSQAIYEFAGDLLKWSANEPGKDSRPSKFDKTQEIEALLVTFKRAKE